MVITRHKFSDRRGALSILEGSSTQAPWVRPPVVGRRRVEATDGRLCALGFVS